MKGWSFMKRRPEVILTLIAEIEAMVSSLKKGK